MHSALDSVAQLAEQLTLNQWVEGSNPSGVTIDTVWYKNTSTRVSIIVQFSSNASLFKASIWLWVNGAFAFTRR